MQDFFHPQYGSDPLDHICPIATPGGPRLQRALDPLWRVGAFFAPGTLSMVHRASTLSNGEGETDEFDCKLKLIHRSHGNHSNIFGTLHYMHVCSCYQLLQYIKVFTINSYLPWPRNSASQELYLDLPADNSAPDDSEDEKCKAGKEGENLDGDLRDRVCQVPIPSPTTIPVVPALAESVDGNSGVLENDLWVPEALPVDEQECLFGLHKKIKETKARIAELKGQDSNSTGTSMVLPSDPVPEKASPVDSTSSRAAEIRSRIEKLQSDLKFLVSTIDQFPSV